MSPILDESLTSWIGSGEPTLYLAGDVGVAIAEWGRRFPIAFTDGAVQPAVRDVYRLHLRLGSVLDLRAPSAIPGFEHIDTPDAFRNVALTRRVASWVRTTTRAQAMLVPSIAFLDDLSRWNLVVFLDKVPTSTTTWITQVDRLGPLSWDPASG